MRITRRHFLATATSASVLAMAGGNALASALAGPAGAATVARWHRYSATSPEGQKMLASYARGVQAMLKLPPDNPHNWFRQAFIHLMDCPHGNWWFYVWHRGYVAHMEQMIRRYSGDADFAMPYWDWTGEAQIPASMFKDVLTPTDSAYRPYTGTLEAFSAIKPYLKRYWDGLDQAQRGQLALREYREFEDVWNSVIGFNPATGAVEPGDAAFATTDKARCLSAGNPRLDDKTRDAVSPAKIDAGLAPVDFSNDDVSASFTSSRTSSHMLMGDFSLLESFPHNKVHNCIGGVGPRDPGPYGNMTNFLSPVDPVFFLHHANMDRLWEVWNHKQLANNLPILPVDAGQRQAFLAEPFLFFVDVDGQPARLQHAGDYLSVGTFGYDYVGGYGAQLAAAAPAVLAAAPLARVQGRVDGEVVRVALPSTHVQAHLLGAGQPRLVAEVTVDRPHAADAPREFDVLINAPDGLTQVEADSPFYAGTIAFIGPMMHGMDHSHGTTFAIPLPPTLAGLAAANASSAAADAGNELVFRLVPAGGGMVKAKLRSVVLAGTR